jgi:hypothetical protein
MKCWVGAARGSIYGIEVGKLDATDRRPAVWATIVDAGSILMISLRS